MRYKMRLLRPATLLAALFGCTATQPKPGEVLIASPQKHVSTHLSPQVWSFIDRKGQLARRLAKKLGAEPDPSTLECFALARKGKFRGASRIFYDLAERGGMCTVQGAIRKFPC